MWIWLSYEWNHVPWIFTTCEFDILMNETMYRGYLQLVNLTFLWMKLCTVDIYNLWIWRSYEWNHVPWIFTTCEFDVLMIETMCHGYLQHVNLTFLWMKLCTVDIYNLWIWRCIKRNHVPWIFTTCEFDVLMNETMYRGYLQLVNLTFLWMKPCTMDIYNLWIWRSYEWNHVPWIFTTCEFDVFMNESMYRWYL